MSSEPEPTAAPVFRSQGWGWLAATGAAALLLLTIAVVAARFSTVSFVGAGIALVALLAAASVRWPRALVVLVILMPIFDRYLVIGLLPFPTWQVAYFMSEALLLGVGSVLAVRAHLDGRLAGTLRHPVTIGLVAFVAVAVLSAVLNAVSPAVAVAGIVLTIEAAACFYLPRLVGFTARQSAIAVAAFVALMLGAAVVALAQAVLAPDILGLVTTFGRFGESYRLASFFADPLVFGALLITAVPFAVFASVTMPRREARWAALAAASLLILALWLSFSRGAWLAMLIGSGAVAALVDRRALLVGATVTAVAFGAALAMPRDLLIPGDDRPDLVDSTFGRIATIGSGRDLRTQFVLNAIPIFADHPIVGVGPGRYGGAAADIFGTPVYAEYGTDALFTRADQSTVDNFWLHLGVELGLLGTAAYIATLLAAGLPILRAALTAVGQRRILLAGIAAAAASIAVNSLTTMLLEANAVAFLFWFLLGIGSLLAAPATQEPG